MLTSTSTGGQDAPTAPGRIPGLGHTRALLRDPVGFIGSLSPVGGVVRIHLGTRKVCVVTDPTLVHSLLVTCADGCPAQHTLKTAFAPERMAACVPVVQKVTRERVDRWQRGQVLDVAEEMNRLALEIVARALFDTRLRDGGFAAFQRALPDLVKGRIVQLLYPRPSLARLSLPLNRRFDAAVRALGEVVDRTVSGPLLHSAAETMSATLTRLFDELLRQRDVMSRIVAELDGQLGSDEHDLSMGAIEHLPYTRSVVQEVVRLHTPDEFLLTTAGQDVELGPYRIPAGTELLYNRTALHRAPALYPDPQRFRPDRWKDTSVGGGFAGAELAVVVATVLRMWQPVTASGWPWGRIRL
ncbi:cytochrome P450 [Streptomyces spiramyceticus]|uniref:cytochrome P450 n=1 Tax=Streptomyces spiramyceticus TaxID=299717 RepID=UPI00237C3801|nr:cytochrome P450 [Streptomyces spiramyceticus]